MTESERPPASTRRAGASPRAELGAAWVALGVLLAMTFGRPFVPGWLVLLGIPWVAGALLLRSGNDERIRLALHTAWQGRALRWSVALLAILLMAVTSIFSFAAALFLLVWLGAIALAFAVLGEGERLRGVVTGVTTLGLALILVGLVLELVLRAPVVSRELGTTPELEQWDHRYDGLWNHNIFGFRSRYEQVARVPGTVRIVALGDSYTWGDKIASSDSVWPQRLERLLEARHPGVDFEVIDMAQRAFTTVNEAETLRRIGWQFDPDVVLIQFLSNDAFPSGPDFHRATSAQVLGWSPFIPERFRRGSIRESALRAFVVEWLNALLADGRRYRWSTFADDAPGWRDVRRSIHEIADSAARRHVPVCFVVFPALIKGNWTTESFPERWLNQKAARFAAQAGLDTLDLTSVFASRGGNWGQWWATPYDQHPGLAAHREAAGAIAARLESAPWFVRVVAMRRSEAMASGVRRAGDSTVALGQGAHDQE